MRGTIVAILMIALVAGIALAMGCGAEMTVQKKETVFAQPSQPPSAAVLSGAGVSSGGEHYKAVQTVGAPISKPVQQGKDGTYKVR